MATIPTSIGLRQAPQPSQSVATYQPQRMNAGEVVAAAGEEQQRAAMIVAQTNDRQDQMVAQDAANRLQAKTIDLQVGPQGFANVKEGAAVGPKFIEDYTSKWTEEKERIREGLTNPNQQRMFDQHADVGLLRYRGSLLSHQSQQTNVFNERTENDTIDLARRTIFANPGDPSAVASSLAKLNWAIENKGQRNGWSAETVALTKEKYLNSVFSDAVAMMVESDPTSALVNLNKRLGVEGAAPEATGNVAIDGLDPQQLVRYRHQANAAVVAAMNRSENEAKARETEALRAVKELRDFVLTGQMVSPDYALQVRSRTAGTPVAQEADALIGNSYTGSMFGSRPLPEQDAFLREWGAKKGQAGSDPEQEKFYRHAQTINENQRAAYAENPWAAVSRFARAPETPEVKIDSAYVVPSLVAERLKTQPLVERYAGKAVSPLQPNEALAFATLLREAPPEHQADILGQIGEAIKDAPRIAALGQQLDKVDKLDNSLSLALKLGATKTAEDLAVSRLVLLGAQALRDKSVKVEDQQVIGWRAQIANLVRGTLGSEAAENDVINAAFYVRAHMELRGSNAAVRYDNQTPEAAVEIVAGRPVNRSGVRTLLPRGMTPGQFDDALRSPQVAEQINDTVYVRGMAVSKRDFLLRLPSLAMRVDGRGRYIPMTNGAMFTLDAHGTLPLAVDVRP